MENHGTTLGILPGEFHILFTRCTATGHGTASSAVQGAVMAVVTVRGRSSSSTVRAQPERQRNGGAPAFAVFDLDRTLLKGSSLGTFARALAAAGVISRGDVLRHVVHQGIFTSWGLSATTLEKLCADIAAAAAGRSQEHVLEVAEQVAPSVAGRLYPAARWLVRQHAERGDRLVLLSAGPCELVGAVARALGFDDALGTVGEVVDGRYTGRLVDGFCHGEGKLRRLRTLLGPLDLLRCTAYGDAASDLPVLRAVAHPVAVNPDRRLAIEAEAARWPVLRLA